MRETLPETIFRNVALGDLRPADDAFWGVNEKLTAAELKDKYPEIRQQHTGSPVQPITKAECVTVSEITSARKNRIKVLTRTSFPGEVCKGCYFAEEAPLKGKRPRCAINEQFKANPEIYEALYNQTKSPDE